MAALIVGVLTAAFHALLHPRIVGGDAFYHVGHARAYADSSLLDTAFPWTAFSAIGEVGADLWWGFHALILPVASVADEPAGAVRIAAVVLTVAALAAVARLALRHGFLAAPLWPALFFLAVPNVLFRYLTVRPEVLSVPLVLLLLSALARRRPWPALALSAAVTWIHLSMFWLGPGMALVWAGAARADRRLAGRRHATRGLTGRGDGSPGGDGSRGTEAPRAGGTAPGETSEPAPARAPSSPTLIGAVLAGTALGWLLRPNPGGAAELAWIQVARLLLEKTGDSPLTFAVELAPLAPSALLATAWPLLVAWLGGLAWLGTTAVRRPERVRAVPARERILLWSSTALAAGFLVLTVAVARRSLVHWAAFAVVGTAVVVTGLTPEARRGAGRRALLLAVPFLFAWSLWRNALNVRYVALAPDHLEEVAGWLEEASAPGDLVFNTHWDTFGPLFARNRVNRYVGGMDPIFQFARDPAAYWAYHHLSVDRATAVTCPRPDCAPEQARDTWEVLRRDFGARWVLVEPRRNPRLSLFLVQDARFRLALETRHEAVFEVLPPGRPASQTASGTPAATAAGAHRVPPLREPDQPATGARPPG